MPIPMELQHASENFERFLADAKDFSGLTTRNQTYTMVQGVLVVFRRRLSLSQAISFAQALPPVLRAIFVADWKTDNPIQSFSDRSSLTKEVQGFRQDHNFSPDSCISSVAKALRRHVDPVEFERALAALPPEASFFWEV